jgi:hypothetical protein
VAIFPNTERLGMATFLILPPRELIEHAVCSFANRLIPGFAVPPGLWERFIDELVTPFEQEADGPVFLLHREDLAEGSVGEGLIDGFGAEQGDRVIEIDSPRPQGPGAVRRWAISGVRQTSNIV